MDHQRTRAEGSGMQTGYMRSSEGVGVGLSAARKSGERLNWNELVRVENGGPGEVPGREEAVREAKELSERKRRERGLRKKR